MENGTFSWQIEQGVEMGRPSKLAARSEKDGGKVVGAWIGGASVLVSRGELEVGEGAKSRSLVITSASRNFATSMPISSRSRRMASIFLVAPSKSCAVAASSMGERRWLATPVHFLS